MSPMVLHDRHACLGARFGTVNGFELVLGYGRLLSEYQALRQTAAWLDLGCRTRLCVLGRDRLRFLNGQVTNDLKALRPGEGCYAALVTAKGRLESDANLWHLGDEFLLDAEPGFAGPITQRLERYAIADDVQIRDVSPHYGLLCVEGPRSAAALEAAGLRLGGPFPVRPFTFTELEHPEWGRCYLMNHPRFALPGFDVFVLTGALPAAAEKLFAGVRAAGGGAVGWEAAEIVRVEAGIPRFGADLDATNLPPEAGLEARAISYSKGCYLGQEVIARLRTYGQVTRTLRGLRLSQDSPLPARGDLLFHDGQAVGHVTSAVPSPALNSGIALGYVRREVNEPGRNLVLRTAAGEQTALVTALPFVQP
jgi:folate-binding protein YgfZ